MEKNKEPFLHVTRRGDISKPKAIKIRINAILLGFLLGYLLLFSGALFLVTLAVLVCLRKREKARFWLERIILFPIAYRIEATANSRSIRYIRRTVFLLDKFNFNN